MLLPTVLFNVLNELNSNFFPKKTKILQHKCCIIKILQQIKILQLKCCINVVLYQSKSKKTETSCTL